MRQILKTLRVLLGRIPPMPLLERMIIRKHLQGPPSAANPIFIVGAPRSGTTFLYQVMINHFFLTYLPNMASLFYGFPLFISLKGKQKILHYHDDCESNYGLIKGLWAPSEAGRFFSFLFEREKFTHLTNTIKAYEESFKVPFISKNVNNSFRIARLLQCFPDAVIVMITRETMSNAQSIIHGLECNKLKNSYFQGLKERNRDILLQRVTEKINTINQHIIDAAGDRIFTVSYENLCKNEKMVTKAFDLFYQRKTGIKLTTKDDIAATHNNM